MDNSKNVRAPALLMYTFSYLDKINTIFPFLILFTRRYRIALKKISYSNDLKSGLMTCEDMINTQIVRLKYRAT